MIVVDGYSTDNSRDIAQKPHPAMRVISSTEDPHEVKRCYELGCNVYVPKPAIYDKFSEVLQKLGQFLSIVCVPESSVA